MSIATVDSRGRVTIPADVRRALNLAPKDKVAFTVMPDGTVMVRAKNRSFLSVAGMLVPPEGVFVSIEEMNLGR